MFKLSKCSKTFMKLSGCFSEMTASLKTAPVDEIFLALQPYLVVLLATFGPFRYVSGEHFSSHLGLSQEELLLRHLLSRAKLQTPLRRSNC
jgi:hypothetical protein